MLTKEEPTRKKIADAIEKVAVDLRDGSASGTIQINDKFVGNYCITTHVFTENYGSQASIAVI